MFDEAFDFLDSVENTTYEVFRRGVNENSFILEDGISEEQLFEKGIDGVGRKLPGYSPLTISIKRSKGQPIDRTTLRDTGDFHRSITIKASGDFIVVESDDPKAGDLIRRYGIDILKPTTENIKDFYNDYIEEELRKEFNDKITG